MSSYIRVSGNQFFIRYGNDTAWVYDDQILSSQCYSCCPRTSLTIWDDPDTVCNNPYLTHKSPLTSPYYLKKQGIQPTEYALSVLSGVPPMTNFSSEISITIPEDPVFSGTYVFNRRPSDGKWIYNTKRVSQQGLSTYNDINSSINGQYLISLTETSGEPTYQGYVEVARSGGPTSNLSGVFAYPARFVFSAIQPPSDASTRPFPTTTGYRAVLGFQLPIRWRHEYKDWIVSDQVGHAISGSIYNESGYGPTPSINLSVSGYATSMSGSGTIGLSGIKNSPATYNLSDTTTAITGANVGLQYLGFCYKTSASGLPFTKNSTDDASYLIDMNNFTGIRQQFNKYTVTYNSTNYTLDETRLFTNKQDMVAYISFTNFCRTSGTMCTDMLALREGVVSTGTTNISTSCFGSYINADYVCGDNVSRPDGTYFDVAEIDNINIMFSGLPQNIYPCVKANNTTASVYKAGDNEKILISNPYGSTEGVTWTRTELPNLFRRWLNENLHFVTLDNSNNVVVRYPGVDIYWDSSVSPNAEGGNTMYAKILPVDSAPFEAGTAGVYLYRINNVNSWDSAGGPTSEFYGRYAYVSADNRYVLETNSNIQIRFIVDAWHLGKIENNNFVTYYVLRYTTGGNPSYIEADIMDYSAPITTSTWNKLQIPVNCSTEAIGLWSSVGYAGTGTAITIKDPIPAGDC